MKKKGFTLIELLVVIAVIALLLAVLAPALNKAKMSAKKVLCKSNEHQWGLACNSWASSNDDKLPRQDLPPCGMNAWDVSVKFLSFDSAGNFGFYNPTPATSQPCELYSYGINQEEFVYCPLMAKRDYSVMKLYLSNRSFNLWLGYSWWVPRGTDLNGDNTIQPTEMFPFDYPLTATRKISWPTRMSSKGISVYPIMTDCVLRLSTRDDLTDNPIAVTDLTRVSVNGLFSNEVYGLHAQNGLLTDVNWLFADGHVEVNMNDGTNIRTRYWPSASQYKNMY